MPTARLPYSNPFGSGERPYLVVHLSGPNNRGEYVWGLLDSGADRTGLPIGFASLLGYDSSTLTPTTVGTAGAPVDGFEATVPCAARVLGDTVTPVSLKPIFVLSPSAYALWGRSDFMRAFKQVAFEEAAKHFLLSW